MRQSAKAGRVCGSGMRGVSRVLSHRSRFARECHQEGINDDDDGGCVAHRTRMVGLCVQRPQESSFWVRPKSGARTRWARARRPRKAFQGSSLGIGGVVIAAMLCDSIAKS